MSLTDPLLLNTVPPSVRLRSEEQNTDLLAFSGILEKEPVSYALFSMEAGSENVRLEYLYTLPERRKQGVAKEILSHAASFFQKRHKKAMGCRISAPPEETECIDEVLYHCGFVPLSLLNRLFVYESADLLPDLPESKDEPFPFDLRGKILYVLIEDETDSAALCPRLSATLWAAQKEGGSDFRILVQFTEAQTFHLLVESFGQPEEQYLIHDLCLLLEES